MLNLSLLTANGREWTRINVIGRPSRISLDYRGVGAAGSTESIALLEDNVLPFELWMFEVQGNLLQHSRSLASISGCQQHGLAHCPPADLSLLTANGREWTRINVIGRPS